MAKNLLNEEQMKWPEEEFGAESERQKQFKEDIEKAGYKVRTYRGRSYYKGWAAGARKQSDFQAIMGATEVPLQWDQLGLGWIVYPES